MLFGHINFEAEPTCNVPKKNDSTTTTTTTTTTNNNNKNFNKAKQSKTNKSWIY
jgi:hypothetical protein